MPCCSPDAHQPCFCRQLLVCVRFSKLSICIGERKYVCVCTHTYIRHGPTYFCMYIKSRWFSICWLRFDQDILGGLNKILICSQICTLSLCRFQLTVLILKKKPYFKILETQQFKICAVGRVQLLRERPSWPRKVRLLSMQL